MRLCRKAFSPIASASSRRKGSASANTYRRNCTRLKTIFKWCVAQGFMSKLPVLPQYAQEKKTQAALWGQ